MLNRVWFWLLLIGIVYGLAKGTFVSVREAQRQKAVQASDMDGVEDGPEADAEDNQSDNDADNAEGDAEDNEEGDAVGDAVPRGLSVVGKDINAAIVSAAEVSVTICIELIGIMALWLGLMRVAEDAGLVDSLASLLRPVMRWLFPGVPDGHPAQGAMLMNISANMLGLENAATPLGLKAMRELQTLNSTDDTATDDMATFLAINTSNVTLIPFAIIGYRAAAGSTNPSGPLFAIILTTSVATIVAIVAVRWLSRMPRFAMTAPLPKNRQASDERHAQPGDE